MYDLIIIGGGQAGLAAAYYAKQHKLNYLVLESHGRVGDSWRNRYDSLTLFTPRRYSQLPGMALDGEPAGYPTKNEIADYLERYVEHYSFNVRLNEAVTAATPDATGYRITTSRGEYTARHLIVATGPFHTPRIPNWSSQLSIPNLHSADYRSPSQLSGQNILVVGGGNSGAQIAEEIATSHSVTLAVAGKMRFLPEKLLGKSLFWWMDTLGILNAPSSSFVARKLQQRGDPIIGTSLRPLLRDGSVTLKPVASSGNGTTVTYDDGSSADFDSVVWCTGYTSDYSWLKIDDVVDERGRPRHDQGVSTAAPHLYFMGLGWMRSRNSALIGGVGRDAKYIVEKFAS